MHFPSSFYPHGAHAKRLVIEGRVPAEVRSTLSALGHDVQVTGDWVNGQVVAVRFDPDTGLIEGAASPRHMSAYAIGR
jgi:gamma-glutamyltranspeptidase/glutathione hydrolase